MNTCVIHDPVHMNFTAQLRICLSHAWFCVRQEYMQKVSFWCRPAQSIAFVKGLLNVPCLAAVGAHPLPAEQVQNWHSVQSAVHCLFSPASYWQTSSWRHSVTQQSYVWMVLSQCRMQVQWDWRLRHREYLCWQDPLQSLLNTREIASSSAHNNRWKCVSRWWISIYGLLVI